jgi:hypothetical protein
LIHQFEEEALPLVAFLAGTASIGCFSFWSGPPLFLLKGFSLFAFSAGAVLIG